ncbi:hypothetical protein FFF34_010050 [Inquilinus sp. KBS0705]|nr:hypothetical protein FFF34_010050 [Inquilinus sp. KBS0705]
MKKASIIWILLLIGPFLYSFKAFMDEQEWITWGNRFLTESYDPSTEAKIKKWEISLTPDHFIRLQKTYQQGKREYYSFNLQRFNGLEYVPGQAATDTLEMKTQADDIIIQTFDDPKGDIDSMGTILDIPVKKLAPERLDSLKQALQFLKAKSL